MVARMDLKRSRGSSAVEAALSGVGALALCATALLSLIPGRRRGRSHTDESQSAPPPAIPPSPASPAQPAPREERADEADPVAHLLSAAEEIAERVLAEARDEAERIRSTAQTTLDDRTQHQQRATAQLQQAHREAERIRSDADRYVQETRSRIEASVAASLADASARASRLTSDADALAVRSRHEAEERAKQLAGSTASALGTEERLQALGAIERAFAELRSADSPIVRNVVAKVEREIGAPPVN